MNNNHISRLLLPAVLILASLFAAPPEAGAVSDIIYIVADVLDATSPNPFGIDGQTLIDAADFFTCIDNGEDPLICYDDHFRKILEGKGIIGVPSWFTKFVDGYVAIVTEDYWGLFASWGEMAYCAACNYLTGVDVCSLIGLYVEAFEEVSDLATSILNFFGIDVGSIASWAWDTLEDAWCSIFGCDEDAPPQPPAEAVAYVDYFYPSISSEAGLAAIKASERSFQLHYESLRSQALAAGIPPAQVDIAGAKYKTALDDQWTGDMVKTVLGDLASKRNQYNKPDQINSLAQAAWTQWLNGSWSGSHPEQNIFDGIYVDGNPCTAHFRSPAMGYEHVDRWISKFPSKAQALNVKNNGAWCFDVFVAGNEASFKDFFRKTREDRVRASCPEVGQKFSCPTTAAYGQCLTDLSYAGEQDRCTFSSEAANAALNQLDLHFKSRGSTIECTKVLSNSPGAKAKYTCTRPVQQKKCIDYFSGSPIKLVDCALIENQAYADLRDALNVAVITLNSAHGAGWVKQLPDKDPLLVQHAVGVTKVVSAGSSQLPEADLYKDQNFQPPSTQPGFVIVDSPYDNLPFDGLSSPTLEMVKTELSMAGVKPPMDKGGLAVAKPKLKEQTAAQKLKDQMGAGGFTPNPVDSNPDSGSNMMGSSGVSGAGPATIGGSKVLGGSGKVVLPGSPGVGGLDGGGSIQGINVLDKMAGSGLSKGVALGGAATGPAGPTLGDDALAGAKRASAGVTASSPGAKRVDGAAGMQLQQQGLSESALGSSQGPAGGSTATMPMSGSLPPGSTPPSSPGAAGGSPGMKPMSGSLPPGVTPPSSKGTAATAPPPPTPLPDIAVLGQLKVAGLPVAWNGTVAVDAKQAVSKNKNNSGLCEYEIEYGLNNSGGPMKSSFTSIWTNDAVTDKLSRQWSPLAAGAQRSVKELIAMKPGSNKLQVVIDDQQQVKESNERNNAWRFTVNVTGKCAETVRQQQLKPAPPLKR